MVTQIQPLGEFLRYLHRMGVAQPSFECHKVVFKIPEDAAGDVVGTTIEIEPSQACVYSVLPTPKEFKEDAQNAGSRLLLGDVGSWDLPASKHSNGLLKMAPSVDYIDSRQFKGIAPGKPGIYLTKNIKVSKGNLRKIC